MGAGRGTMAEHRTQESGDGKDFRDKRQQRWEHLRCFPAELFATSSSRGASIADAGSLMAQRVKDPPARQEI